MNVISIEIKYLDQRDSNFCIVLHSGKIFTITSVVARALKDHFVGRSCLNSLWKQSYHIA